MAAGTFWSKSVNPANSRGISDLTGKADKTVIPSCVATAWPSRSKVVLPIPASPSIRRTREPPASSPRKLVILAASASRPMSIGFTSAVSFSRGMALSMALRVNFRVTKDVRKAAGLGLDIAQPSWWSDTARTTATTGVPAIQPGATPTARRQGPTRFSSEGSTFAVAERSFLCRAIRISGAAPGTTCGNHRANYPRHLRAHSGMIFAVQMREPTRKAGRNSYLIPSYKREAGGSNPPAPTKFVQIDGLLEL